MHVEVIEKDKVITQGEVIKVIKSESVNSKKAVSELEIKTDKGKIVKILLDKGLQLRIGATFKMDVEKR